MDTNFFTVEGFGLLTVSFSSSPLKHLPLMLEVSEYLKQYAAKLDFIHENYLDALKDIETAEQISQRRLEHKNRSIYLYKPRFISTLGNQDICVQLLVDDFELLENLPYFEYAEKQDCSLSLIPDYSNWDGLDLKDVLLDPREKFSYHPSDAYYIDKDKLKILTHPIYALTMVKFDAFLKFELGLAACRDYISFLWYRAIEFNKSNSDDQVLILPSITLDWSEVYISILSKRLQGVLSFLGELTLTTANSILSEDSKQYLSKSMRITHAKHMLCTFDKCHAYSGLEKKNMLTSVDALKPWDVPKIKDWASYEEIASSDSAILKVYTQVPESIVFHAFVKKTLRREDVFFSTDSNSLGSYLNSVHLSVFTNTFLGLPLSYAFYRCLVLSDPSWNEKEHGEKLDLTYRENLAGRLEKSLDEYLYQDKKFESAFTSAYNLASDKSILHGFKNLDSAHYAWYIIDFGFEIAKLLKKDKTPLSAIIDVPMYHFGFTKKEEIKNFNAVLGKCSLRRTFDEVYVFDFSDELIKANLQLGNVLFASTHSSVSFPISFQYAGSPHGKVGLKKFILKSAPNLVVAKLKAMNLSKYVVDNFLDVITRYNHYIQDPVKFENLVEVTPVIWKIHEVFESFKEVTNEGVIHQKSSGEPDGRVHSLTTRELIKQLEDLVETFNSFYRKRCLNTSLDQDFFQTVADKTSSSHVLLSLASGAQRILMTYLLGQGKRDYVKMAALFTEGEGEILYHKNAIVPKTVASRRHLLSVEHIPLIFHEVGHSFMLSDMFEGLQEEFNTDIEAQLLDLLFHPTERHMDQLTGSQQGLVEIASQVVPDLFYFVLGCNDDLQLFVDKYLFHKFYIHNFPKNSKDILADSYWARVYFVILIAQVWNGDVKDLNSAIEAIEERANTLTKHSRLSGNDKEPNDGLFYNSAPPAKITFGLIAESLAVGVGIAPSNTERIERLKASAFRMMFMAYSLLKDKATKENLVGQKDDFSRAISRGEVLALHRDLEVEYNPSKQVSALLRCLTSEVMSGGEGKQMVFERIEKQSTQLDGAKIPHPNERYRFPQNPSPVLIHPSIGAFSIDTQWRSRLFKTRASSMLLLHHLILQEKSILVSQMLNLQEIDLELTQTRFSDIIR